MFTKPARLAVFVSGRGSNLQALLDYFNRNRPATAEVVVVFGSPGGAEALERARHMGVPTRLIDPGLPPEALSDTLLASLVEFGADLVVLAGYVRLIPGAVVERYRGRMINIHPALLPSFGGSGMYGIRVHRAVLASGARVSGATVHLVDEHYDEGGIVAQWPVPVYPEDSPEELAARVLAIEHRLLPAAIEALIDGAGSGERSSQAPTGFTLTDLAEVSTESVTAFLIRREAS